MQSDEINRKTNSKGPTERLADEELARLLGDDLEPEERAALVEKLQSDPEAAEILALAASDVPSTAQGLPSRTVDSLLDMVREKGGETDICPHCAGDLYPGGAFCPHCAARVVGNPLACHQCGSRIVEGSSYCPSCGSIFRPFGPSPAIESPFLMLIIGLVSLGIAIAYRPLIFLFMSFGVVSLGVWGWDLWTRRLRVRRASKRVVEVSQEREKERRERKTG